MTLTVRATWEPDPTLQPLYIGELTSLPGKWTVDLTNGTLWGDDYEYRFEADEVEVGEFTKRIRIDNVDVYCKEKDYALLKELEEIRAIGWDESHLGRHVFVADWYERIGDVKYTHTWRDNPPCWYRLDDKHWIKEACHDTQHLEGNLKALGEEIKYNLGHGVKWEFYALEVTVFWDHMELGSSTSIEVKSMDDTEEALMSRSNEVLVEALDNSKENIQSLIDASTHIMGEIEALRKVTLARNK